VTPLWRIVTPVAPIDIKQRAERRMLELIDGAGLPPPDTIEHGERCVRFLWHDRKVAVVVDVSEFDELDGNEGHIPEGIVI
jgi:hypothetical protein